MKKLRIACVLLALGIAAPLTFAQVEAPKDAAAAEPAMTGKTEASTAPADTSSTVIEDIVARINNNIITNADLARSKEQLEQDLKQQYGEQAQAHYAEREKDVLRDLIDQDLLVQKGKDLGINADNELIKRLDEIRKKMGLDSMDALEKAAQAQGVSYEDFKNNLRNQIITQDVIGQEVGAHIQITHEEEQKFYEEHKAQLEKPEQVRLSEILVAIPQSSNDSALGPDPALAAKAQSKAEEIEKQLKAGGDFAALAKKDSDGPTAPQGGDLGYFKRGTLAQQLEDVTFALKTGQFTQPIRTKQGYIILKVTEHEQAGLPPLEQVRNNIDNGIYMEKLQPALRAYLTKLREEAYIKIKPGYTDTGAAPEENSPIVMVGTPAQQAAKAKKKKKKFLIF